MEDRAAQLAAAIQELAADPFSQLPRKEQARIADEEMRLFDQWKRGTSRWVRFRAWLADRRFIWRLGKTFQTYYGEEQPERGEMLRKISWWRLGTIIGGEIHERMSYEGSARRVFSVRPIGETDRRLASMVRASGECICEDCGKLYRKHPDFTEPEGLSYDGRPFLKVLCDGTLVKL